MYTDTDGSQISVPTLQETFKVLLSIAHQWKSIAIILGIPHDEVKVVERENRDVVNDCLCAMLNKWLKQTNPKPCWKDLADAVEHLGDQAKAKEIRDTHLST